MRCEPRSMGVQGSFAPGIGDVDSDARFDAIVGTASAAAPESARPARLGLAPRERRRRAVITLTALLGGGALVGATLLVGTGALSFSPAASDKLAGATTPVADAAVAPTVSGSASAVYGTAVSLSDSVSVLVSAPAGFVPSRKARGNDQAQQLVFTVTVTNTGSVDQTPTLAISAAAGTAAASAITDSKQGLQLPGSDPVAAGSSRTFRVAFSAAGSDVTLTVSGAGGRTIAFHS